MTHPIPPKYRNGGIFFTGVLTLIHTALGMWQLAAHGPQFIWDLPVHLHLLWAWVWFYSMRLLHKSPAVGKAGRDTRPLFYFLGFLYAVAVVQSVAVAVLHVIGKLQAQLSHLSECVTSMGSVLIFLASKWIVNKRSGRELIELPSREDRQGDGFRSAFDYD